MNAIKTTHRLNFEVGGKSFGHQTFRVGTCTGQWGSTSDSYYILSVINSSPGNGHFEDVLQWFEFSANRDKRNLLILEILDGRFYNHLLLKRGFVALDKAKKNAIKIYNPKLYLQLKQNGNEIINAKTLNCI